MSLFLECETKNQGLEQNDSSDSSSPLLFSTEGLLHSRQVLCYCAIASASQLVWFVLVAKRTFPFKISSIQRAVLKSLPGTLAFVFLI